jgi:Fe-S cluster biogenesis protein NfuA
MSARQGWQAASLAGAATHVIPSRVSPLDAAAKDQIDRICREVLAPLVRADGGEMHFVRFDGDEVHIHLTGVCAGCPGASLTGEKVIVPALRTAAPKVRLVLTTGIRAPEGSRKV